MSNNDNDNTNNNTLLELKSNYEDFLRNERWNYGERIATCVDDCVRRDRCPRIRIPLPELRSDNPRLERRLRLDPLRHLRALEAACHTLATEERPGYDKDNGVRIKVAIAGPMTALSPRQLNSSLLRRLVSVEGVATRVSAARPKIVRSVHFCPATSQFETRDYVDATDPHLGLPALDSSGRELTDTTVTVTSSVYPTKDKHHNALQTEYGLSTYKDHQVVTLQEMPERAPMGQLPRSVELILDHDLVDTIKPGDRVLVVGVYRVLATNAFKTVVLLNHVERSGRDDVTHLRFSPLDIRNIKALSRRNDILDVLGRGMAPSIHGHEQIKKALILQLLSGCEKNLPNGTHLRGDVNILIVGDPSTAKSQLLRATMMMAPLSLSTTGKGSSGVGLTAAVTSDPDTRERRLEAGAMVLADRGIVCIDEFDKMSESDRVAIHEAMEQQTVTIAKAGIHASLNARCSVLAAANPVYGHYDRTRRIQDNIGLPDSLVSRFDLLFVVLDQLDPDSDCRIAAHVIQGHRYRPPAHDSDDDEEEDGNAEGDKSIWQRHTDDVLQREFVKKYIYFAKTRIRPVLTEEARECIAQRYAEMRSRQQHNSLCITARSLETLIRLASAHAKARLSSTVEADPDCIVAMDIMSFALYHTIPTTTTTEEKRMRDSPSSPLVEEKDVRKRSRSNEMEDPVTGNMARQIWQQFTKSGQEEVAMNDICKDIFDRELISRAIALMEREEKVMVTNGIVFVI